MAPERAIASMPVVISAVPIRTRRSVPEQKASAKAARIEYSMIKPPMRTCSSMQSIRMVSKEAGTETDVDFVRAGLTEPVSFEKNRF
ncbi:MAG: hypothetical protein ACLR3S_06490 [Clostridium fessum]